MRFLVDSVSVTSEVLAIDGCDGAQCTITCVGRPPPSPVVVPGSGSLLRSVGSTVVGKDTEFVDEVNKGDSLRLAGGMELEVSVVSNPSLLIASETVSGFKRGSKYDVVKPPVFDPGGIMQFELRVCSQAGVIDNQFVTSASDGPGLDLVRRVVCWDNELELEFASYCMIARVLDCLISARPILLGDPIEFAGTDAKEHQHFVDLMQRSEPRRDRTVNNANDEPALEPFTFTNEFINDQHLDPATLRAKKRELCDIMVQQAQLVALRGKGAERAALDAREAQREVAIADGNAALFQQAMNRLGIAKQIEQESTRAHQAELVGLRLLEAEMEGIQAQLAMLGVCSPVVYERTVLEPPPLPLPQMMNTLIPPPQVWGQFSESWHRFERSGVKETNEARVDHLQNEIEDLKAVRAAMKKELLQVATMPRPEEPRVELTASEPHRTKAELDKRGADFQLQQREQLDQRMTQLQAAADERAQAFESKAKALAMNKGKVGRLKKDLEAEQVMQMREIRAQIAALLTQQADIERIQVLEQAKLREYDEREQQQSSEEAYRWQQAESNLRAQGDFGEADRLRRQADDIIRCRMQEIDEERHNRQQVQRKRLEAMQSELVRINLQLQSLERKAADVDAEGADQLDQLQSKLGDIKSQEILLEQLKQLADVHASEQRKVLITEAERVAALQVELERLRVKEASQQYLKQQEAQLERMKLQVSAQEQVLETMREHEMDPFTNSDHTLKTCDWVLKELAAISRDFEHALGKDRISLLVQLNCVAARQVKNNTAIMAQELDLSHSAALSSVEQRTGQLAAVITAMRSTSGLEQLQIKKLEMIDKITREEICHSKKAVTQLKERFERSLNGLAMNLHSAEISRKAANEHLLQDLSTSIQHTNDQVHNLARIRNDHSKSTNRVLQHFLHLCCLFLSHGKQRQSNKHWLPMGD